MIRVKFGDQKDIFATREQTNTFKSQILNRSIT